MTEVELLEKIYEEQKNQTKLISQMGIIVVRIAWMIIALIIVTFFF
jgi:hypothetical protein